MTGMNARIAVMTCAALLAACQTSPPQTESPASAPPLRLLHSQPLDIPGDCDASGSFLVTYTVDERGEPHSIAAVDGPGCVSDALVAWVSTFRYAPRSAPVTTAVEWLVVTAPRS